MERLTTYHCGVAVFDKNRYSEVAAKLADYENAEEEGHLMRLPCKVGDTVYTNHAMSGWYMRKSKRPYKGRIVFIGLNEKDPFFNIILEEGKMLQFNFSKIGKTVFLTEEAAKGAMRNCRTEKMI